MNEPESQPLSDADVLAWSVVLTHRARQVHDGINILLLPYPPCPTCGEPVHEAEQVTYEAKQLAFGHLAANNIQLTLRPCGHAHTTSDDCVRRLWLHIHEMTSGVASGYHGHAVEARTWTTDEIVREARARAAGTATEGDSYPPPGRDESLESLRAHAADVSRKTGLDVTVEPCDGQYALAVAHPVGQARHGGYSFDAVHGMLLGIAAAAEAVTDCRCHNGEEAHPHPECPDGTGGKPSIEDTVRLEGALHLLRFALDRAIRADFMLAPEYLRELLDRATGDSGEPCDRDQQYQRAEQAEERAEAASVVGTRHMARAEEAEAEVARLRAGEEPGWDPVAEPSPGQWIARWNASSADERLEVAQRVIEDSARAARCFQMDHETRIVVADKMLAARLRVMNRSEVTVARVRAESARIRSVTPAWGPVADLIDAALDDPARPREQRMRPTHPDGTPYSCYEITAEGWGFCDGCRMWSTGTPENPHQCPETHMQGPIDSKENGDV